MMKKMSFALAALLCAGTASQALAFPRLDVAKSCRAVVASARKDEAAAKKLNPAGSETGSAKQPTFADCMKSEDDARKAAVALWPAVKPQDRTTCASLSGMVYPSYVELRTCLDMAKQAKSPPAAVNATAKTPAGRKMP